MEWSLSKGFKIVKESTGKLEGHVGIVVHALEISVVHQYVHQVNRLELSFHAINVNEIEKRRYCISHFTSKLRIEGIVMAFCSF